MKEYKNKSGRKGCSFEKIFQVKDILIEGFNLTGFPKFSGDRKG